MLFLFKGNKKKNYTTVNYNYVPKLRLQSQWYMLDIEMGKRSVPEQSHPDISESHEVIKFLWDLLKINTSNI